MASSVVFILHGTLSPYDFALPPIELPVGGFMAGLKNVWQSFWHWRAMDLIFWHDFGQNILFFIPLGLGYWWSRLEGTRTTDSSSQRSLPRIYGVLLIGGGLSFLVEGLQFFLPLRNPSFFDVISNTLGALIGYLLPLVWSSIMSVLGPSRYPGLTACLKGILSAGLLIWLLWIPHHSNTLQTWNDTYRLAFGNEVSGGRPWQGAIRTVSIMDQKATKQDIETFLELGRTTTTSVVSRYTFDAPFLEKTEFKPGLVWQGHKTAYQTSGVSVSTAGWLVTEKAPTEMIQALRYSNQFTLSFEVASANPHQTGPARIVSLAHNRSYRNFTLGQKDTALAFRLQTAWTGRNGAQPQLLVPDIFADQQPHRIVVTYKNPNLTVFVDQIQQVHTLNLSPRRTWLWKMLELCRFTQTKFWSLKANHPVLTILSQILYWMLCIVLLLFTLTVVRQGIDIK